MRVNFIFLLFMKKAPIFILLLLIFCSNLVGPAQNLEKFNYVELDSVATSLYRQGNFKLGIKYTQLGRKKARTEFGEKDTIYANFTSKLAEFYRKLGHFEQAESLFNEALEIFAQKIDKDHPDYVNILNSKIILYSNTGRYKQAENLLLKTLKIFNEKMGYNQSSFASYLNNLANLYKDLGRYDQAEPLYIKALEIQAKVLGNNHPNYSATLNNLATLYQFIGQYEQAEPLFQESLKIKVKINGKNHVDYAISLNNLAVLYQDMRRYEKVEPLFQESINVIADNLGKNHYYYAASLNNLAKLYQETGNNKQAEPLYLKSLKILGKNLDHNHHYHSAALNNLASLYKSMKHYQKAELIYNETLNTIALTLGIDHPYYVESLTFLASLYKIRRQFKQSWHYIKLAIYTMSQIDTSYKIDSTWSEQLKNIQFNRYSDEMIKALNCLYDLLAEEKRHEEQLIVADLAMHILKRSKDSFASDKDKLRLLGKSHNWMLRSLGILDLNKDFQKAFTNVEIHKSVLLMEATKAVRAYQIGGLPDSLILQETQMKNTHSELQAKLSKKRPDNEKDSLRTLLNELNLQINNFKKRVEKKYPKYAKLKYQSYTATVPEIQHDLDNDHALIEYVLGDSIVYVFYIDKEYTQTFRILIPIDSLKHRIQALHQTFSDFTLPHQNKPSLQTYQTYSKNAYWCYEQLLKPILIHKKGIKHLIIIPDGELGHLPFEAFLLEKDSSFKVNYSDLHYLIKDYDISYHYSASLWRENCNEPKPQNNGQILAMAGQYDTKPDSTIMELRLPAYRRLRSGLSTLPAARLEVEALAQEFKGYFGFDTLATEQIFKEKVSQYSIIHLAMHGLLNREFPTLSSLVFTESQDSIENNILQAYEISKLSLNANLVVLSACKTGYGRFEKGNGIASLAQAFMYAGVPALVVSLWQVDDLATSKIMKAFYLNLADGMGKAEALRQAKLNYINNAKGIKGHPVFWSPFIQIGDSKPTHIEKKINYKAWFIILIIVLMVTVLIYFRKSIFQ